MDANDPVIELSSNQPSNNRIYSTVIIIIMLKSYRSNTIVDNNTLGGSTATYEQWVYLLETIIFNIDIRVLRIPC